MLVTPLLLISTQGGWGTEGSGDACRAAFADVGLHGVATTNVMIIVTITIRVAIGKGSLDWSFVADIVRENCIEKLSVEFRREYPYLQT